MLESIAEQVFDAYRAALKDDFTTQGVIAASTYGCDIRDWNSIDSKMQDVFWALGAKYPESVDTKKASNLFSDGVVGHLREKGLTISDEQAKLFPDLMESVMQAGALGIEVIISGKKALSKEYTNYSGYPGGLRKINFADLLKKDSREIIKRAVSGMLAKNKFRSDRLNRVHVFPNSDHSFKDKFINK